MLDNTGEQTGRKRRPVESPPGRQARPPPALEIATAATTTTIAAASVPPSARSRRRATAAASLARPRCHRDRRTIVVLAGAPAIGYGIGAVTWILDPATPAGSGRRSTRARGGRTEPARGTQARLPVYGPRRPRRGGRLGRQMGCQTRCSDRGAGDPGWIHDSTGLVNRASRRAAGARSPDREGQRICNDDSTGRSLLDDSRFEYINRGRSGPRAGLSRTP